MAVQEYYVPLIKSRQVKASTAAINRSHIASQLIGSPEGMEEEGRVFITPLKAGTWRSWAAGGGRGCRGGAKSHGIGSRHGHTHACVHTHREELRQEAILTTTTLSFLLFSDLQVN